MALLLVVNLGDKKMNTRRTYDINGNAFTCYFYDNGYDKGVSVFNEAIRDPLFTFDEAVNEKEIIFLLKGYELGVDH